MIEMLELEYVRWETKLKDDQKELKECIEEMKRATAFGDLSENSELDAVKLRIASLTNEITSISEILDKSKIIDLETGNRIKVGSLLSIEEIGSNEEPKMLLLSNSGDILKGLLNVKSPLGKELVGKLPGEFSVLSVYGNKEIRYRVEILNEEYLDEFIKRYSGDYLNFEEI